MLYQQQEYKKAAALYEEAIANDPELSVAYFYLANSYDNLYKPSPQGRAGERRLPDQGHRVLQAGRREGDGPDAADALASSSSSPPTVPTR